jgi:hypothetical protein
MKMTTGIAERVSLAETSSDMRADAAPALQAF